MLTVNSVDKLLLLLLYMGISALVPIIPTDAKTYYLTEKMVTYDVANTTCGDGGLSLPVILSDPDNQELYEFLKGKLDHWVWLGLRLPDGSDDRGRYIWPDGSPVYWTRWNSFPFDWNLATDKCAVMAYNGHWNPSSCFSEHRCVCQETIPANRPNLAAPSSWVAPGVMSSTGEESTYPVRETTLSSYFTCLWARPLNSQPLAITKTASQVTCTAACLRTDGCDVIRVDEAGTCRLYPSADQLTPLPPGQGHKVCQRLRYPK